MLWGRKFPREEYGPRPGWVPFGDGVGRKEIFGEDIGPGPGRVPGLFCQKEGSIIQIRKFDFYQGQMTNTIELFLCEQFFVC